MHQKYHKMSVCRTYFLFVSSEMRISIKCYFQHKILTEKNIYMKEILCLFEPNFSIGISIFMQKGVFEEQIIYLRNYSQVTY